MKDFRHRTRSATAAATACLIAALSSGVQNTSAQAATLLHHYDFSSGVVDLVGSEDGTLLNGAAIVAGRLELDGVDDYVQFATRLIPTEGAWSVSFVASRDRNQGAHTEVVSQGRTFGPGFYVGTAPDGLMRVGDEWTSTGVPFAAPGTPAHYAVTVDPSASSTHLYIDGQLAASRTFAIAVSPEGTTTRLGRQFDPFAEYFDGAIDEFRVYSGALTPGEVAALAAPVPEPSSFALVGAGLAGLLTWRSRRRPGGS